MQSAFRTSYFNCCAKKGRAILIMGSCASPPYWQLQACHQNRPPLHSRTRESTKAICEGLSDCVVLDTDRLVQSEVPNMVSHPLTWQISKRCPCNARQPCHDKAQGVTDV